MLPSILFHVERNWLESAMNSESVREFILKEVPDWDDEVVSIARFKGFSGQRSDWEPRYRFWKDLIRRVARHFHLLIIQPHQVKEWFQRGGLHPLCIDDVLHLMYNEGEVTRVGDLVDLRSGKLSRIFKKLRLLALGPSNAEAAPQDNLLLTALVKDKSSEVIQYLSERHWTSSCIVTMKRFEDICGGSDEALAVFNHLWGCGKSCHLYTHKEEVLEGVKISLSSDAVSGITSLDYDILHLVWTTEKLQQQLNVIDLRYQKSRSLAVASLKSGDRRAALRYARELKLARESREKCDSLMNRVEEVLNVILDAESTRKVFEAIQIGARAMKENNISVEEVKLCLDEIDECIESQKQVENAIVESASSTGFEEEDLEEEFRKWELEIRGENPEMGSGKGTTLEEPDSSGLVESLSNRLGNLRLEVDQTDERVKNESETSMGISNRLSTHLLKPEAA